MQKKLIALAVAGLASTAAFAQSNVTIYGVVDAGYVASSGDRAAGGSANRNGIHSGLLSGSRIGFRGEEGLGNGLKAVFTLEYGLNVDANNGIGSTGLQARQQFIGLSSATLGTVALGRQYAPAFYASGRNDPFMSSTGIGSLARLTFTAGNTISGTGVAGDGTGVNGLGGSRWDNAVTYTSPTWSGFSVRSAYSFGEDNGGANGVSSGDDGKFGLGANYANGGLNLDVVFHHTQKAQLAAVPGAKDVTEWYVGGSYDFKVVKLFASYQDKNDRSDTALLDDSNKVWQVGATVPVFGNGKVHVGYSRLSWDQSGFGDTKAWNLMYSHALSKRTVLYTGYTRFDNERGAPLGFSNDGVGVAGEKNGTFAAGINHAF
ncbi:MAG: porin [Rhodocyclaceae bacterium]|nr:porin [Rhodocyclaceae bacterium]